MISGTDWRKRGSAGNFVTAIAQCFLLTCEPVCLTVHVNLTSQRLCGQVRMQMSRPWKVSSARWKVVRRMVDQPVKRTRLLRPMVR
jgi:DsbC/DsbD-like thiol-disulfide interchange protein